MEYFFVKNGKVVRKNEEDFGFLPSSKSVQEIIKDMTPEELEAFKKERYEKFLKPLFNHNIQELDKKGHKEVVARKKSWWIDPSNRNKNK